jgi:Flp pilus assembly protein TadB
MTGIGMLTVLTLVGVGGLIWAATGWMQPAPPLERVVAHLQRTSAPADTPSYDRRGSLLVPLVDLARRSPRLMPTDSQLALVGRAPEQHAVWLLVAAVGGFVVPPVALSLLQSAGVVGLGWFAPLGLSVVGAVLAPIVLHASTVERAEQVRTDLRYQVSAYLDVVTMLLAGNSGYEGALEQAAHAGDGRLFTELRRRVRESGARGASLTDALARTGAELGLDELEQVAATAALSAAEGAPVARTLAAKCATLRSALATEQESEARLRTSRLTTPIVGMALIFMSLVIYPALSFT